MRYWVREYLRAGFLQLSLQMNVVPVLWLLPTAVFGFLDGFGLPTDIASVRLASLIPVSDVFAFNAGALIAELLCWRSGSLLRSSYAAKTVKCPGR